MGLPDLEGQSLVGVEDHAQVGPIVRPRHVRQQVRSRRPSTSPAGRAHRPGSRPVRRIDGIASSPSCRCRAQPLPALGGGRLGDGRAGSPRVVGERVVIARVKFIEVEDQRGDFRVADGAGGMPPASARRPRRMSRRAPRSSSSIQRRGARATSGGSGQRVLRAESPRGCRRPGNLHACRARSDRLACCCGNAEMNGRPKRPTWIDNLG